MSRIIWLASYPKSGNTWMRAFLANFFSNSDAPYPINELRNFTLSDTRPRFYQQISPTPIQQLTEDQLLDLRPAAMQALANAKPVDHFVKTHNQQLQVDRIRMIDPALSAGAIYIVRNPFDIAPSYASHYGLSIDDAISALEDRENVVRAPDVNIVSYLGHWSDHVASWTNERAIPHICLRYEDMLRNPKSCFGQMLRAMGVPVSDQKLTTAIRNASFKELSAQEMRQGFEERSDHADKFFREGRAGSGKDRLTDVQRQRIIAAHGSVMKRFGYL